MHEQKDYMSRNNLVTFLSICDSENLSLSLSSLKESKWPVPLALYLSFMAGLAHIVNTDYNTFGQLTIPSCFLPCFALEWVTLWSWMLIVFSKIKQNRVGDLDHWPSDCFQRQRTWFTDNYHRCEHTHTLCLLRHVVDIHWCMSSCLGKRDKG